MEPLAFRPETAAETIGVGRTTMYELLRTGEIESIKIGRSRVIPADALRDYLTRKRETTAETVPAER